MGMECSECERDLRAGHDPSCSRYRPPTAKECLDGDAAHSEWPATMQEFYALCTEDDLVRILLRSTYADPWSHYDYSVGDHVRAALRSRQRAE